MVYAVTELADQGVTSPVPLLTLLFGGLLLWVFYRRQRRLPVPLVDFGLFRSPSFAGAVTAQFLVVLAATGALFFLSIYLQKVAGFSTLQTGLALIPVSLVSMVVAPSTGRLLKRFGPRRVLFAGMMASAVGLIGVGVLESFGYWALVVPLALLGFSFGSVLTTAAELVLLSAPPERAGAAVGVSETSFELGGAVGIRPLGQHDHPGVSPGRRYAGTPLRHRGLRHGGEHHGPAGGCCLGCGCFPHRTSSPAHPARSGAGGGACG